MLSENAIKILEKRYLLKDENGNCIEDANGMFRRVAKHVASADRGYCEIPIELQRIENEFFDMMMNLEFLPNSPTLMNAGKPLGQLSACFVLPIEDSMEGIFDSLKHTAMIHKSGGGTGFSFSRLRPKGSIVGSTGGVSSGPVSFMKVFNAATEAVKQGGTRRGANMGLLRVDHPDILEFIRCKNDTSELNNFNVSIGITEAFMKAYHTGTNYELWSGSRLYGELKAKEVFDLIVEQAWKNGEPGIIFLDEINKYNPTPELGDVESTNPCGEQPLLPFEACNLGSINLALMIKNGGVDYYRLGNVVKKAVHFLDNVIDVNMYPLPEIDKMTKSTRKIGLGVMGWADLLIQLSIPYNSERALQLASEVMLCIHRTSNRASFDLARRKGGYSDLDDRALRNATTTTIAPTGTISIIAGVSSGIEPLFALEFERNQADMQMKQESKYKDAPKDVLVTAHDVSPQWHVRMQAAFQKYTDNAVSKTINLHHAATTEDVRKAYLLAYELKCKGVTVYRDGSRDNQTLSIGTSKKAENIDFDDSSHPSDFVLIKRPGILNGFTEKTEIGCGEIFMTVNSNNGLPFEVFTTTGKGGGCPSQSEAAARLASLALREGIDPQKVIKQLKGIRCMSCKGKKVLSCPDAIGKAIEKTIKDDIKVLQDGESGEVFHTYKHTRCGDCGNTIIHEGGCTICPNCGASKCG